jgi:dipeptidyl aminopeptidase/acylaminoacyl peptidase
MTSPRRFEQDLPALIADLYLAGTPDYRDDLVRQTARVRQRPAWTFPERWLPMDLVTKAAPAASRVQWRTLGVLGLLIALLATAVAMYIGSQRRLPEPFGLAANGQIAYADRGDISIRDRVDGPARLLIQDPGTDNLALVSPRGDKLLVAREAAGGEDIVITMSNGTDARRLAGPYVGIDWFDWSPDQRAIAIGYALDGVPSIDIVATDGSGARRLVDFPAMSPRWRPPNGDQLLFRGQEHGRWGLYLVDVAGGEPVRLDLAQQGLESSTYDLLAPAWSPTGDRLAFHTLVNLPLSQLGTPGFRITIATIGPAGAVLDQDALEFDKRADDELNAEFTPDGSNIVFQRRYGWTPADPASGTPTVDRLFVAPADGSGPARDLGVLSMNGDGLSYTVAPDGTLLIAHLSAEGEEWLIDPNIGTAVVTDLGSTSGVSWQRRAP